MLNITYRNVGRDECEAIISFGSWDLEVSNDLYPEKMRRISKVRLILASGVMVAMTLPQFMRAAALTQNGVPFAAAVFENAASGEMKSVINKFQRSLEIVNPDYFRITDGKVKTGSLSRSFVEEMKNAGRSVLPTVSYDGMYTDKIISNIEEIAEDLGYYVRAYKLDGLLFDFPAMASDDLETVLKAIRAQNIEVSAVIYPNRISYDFKDINELCRFVYVDVLRQRPNQTPSPYYSVKKGEETLRKVINSGVDKNKIMLALDMGSRFWGPGWDGSVKISPAQTHEIMELFAVRERYDESTGSVYLDFTVTPNKKYYIGDRRLYPADYTMNTGLSTYMREMLMTVNRLGIKGAALLDLPLAPEEIWQYFHNWLSGGVFSDMSLSYGRDEIMKVCAMGVMEGVGDGRFMPYSHITRGEAAAIVCRFLSLDEKAKPSPFDDVKGHWAEKYINACFWSGHMIGDSDGRFRPDERLTREQAAVLCGRISGVYAKDAGGLFSDVDEDSWSYESIAALHKAGIIKGYSDGTFRPKESITREEMAIIVSRLEKVI